MRLKSGMPNSVALCISFCLGATLFAAGKYIVSLEDVELKPENAEEILKRFEGEIHKIKAVDSKAKPKTTVGVRVDGLKDKAILHSGICVKEGAHVRTSQYPFSALALEFPQNGEFLAKGKIREIARDCIDPSGEGGISRFQAQLSKVRLLGEGREVGRLHLIKFISPDKWFQQLPRKIGE